MTQTPIRRSRRGPVAARSAGARAAVAPTGARRSARTTARTTALPARGETGATGTAVDRAYERRRRRAGRIDQDRFDHGGRTISGSLSKVPFIALIILVLAVGAIGVLVLNTRTSETGVQINRLSDQATELELGNESLQREVNLLDSTQNLADRAKALGLVPAAGDTPIVDCSRTPCVVIKPSGSAADGGNG